MGFSSKEIGGTWECCMSNVDAGELKKKLDFAADLLASFCLNASSIDL